MKGLIKILAGLGAILATATAVAVPQMCTIKAPAVIHAAQQIALLVKSGQL